MTGSKTMSSNNPNPHLHSGKKHSRHEGKKRSFIYNIYKWAKKNPLKIIAILFGILLIYITILFIQYANKNESKERTTLKIEWNNKVHPGKITSSRM